MDPFGVEEGTTVRHSRSRNVLRQSVDTRNADLSRPTFDGSIVPSLEVINHR